MRCRRLSHSQVEEHVVKPDSRTLRTSSIESGRLGRAPRATAKKKAAVRTVAEILSGEALTPIRRSSVSGTRYLAETCALRAKPGRAIQSETPQAERPGPIPIGSELAASYVDQHDVTVGIEPCVGSQLAGADFELQLHC